jgi:hypothetical protein
MTFYTDKSPAADFARLNYPNLLELPTIKKVDNKVTSIDFKIDENTLRETGLYFLTPLVAHYTRINVYRAWVQDSEQKKPGYGYLSGQLLNEIDLVVAAGLINNNAVVPVKIDLSKYDSLTGLQGLYKNLFVSLHFYNEETRSGI